MSAYTDTTAGIEKVLYPGNGVTSQFQIWEPILWLGQRPRLAPGLSTHSIHPHLAIKMFVTYNSLKPLLM